MDEGITQEPAKRQPNLQDNPTPAEKAGGVPAGKAAPGSTARPPVPKDVTPKR